MWIDALITYEQIRLVIKTAKVTKIRIFRDRIFLGVIDKSTAFSDNSNLSIGGIPTFKIIVRLYGGGVRIQQKKTGWGEAFSDALPVDICHLFNENYGTVLQRMHLVLEFIF